MNKRYFFIICFAILGGVVFVFSLGIEDAYRFNPALVMSRVSYMASNFPYIKAEEVPEEEINIKKQEIDSGVIKSIYLTGYSAGSRVMKKYANNVIDTTQINAVVIDIKDYSGYVFYDTKIPEVEKYGSKDIRIGNIDSLIKGLHDKGVYVIARIAVFQDPVLARSRPDIAVKAEDNLSSFMSFFAALKLWLDRMNLAWIDPASKEAWDYNIAIAKDALERGFDEINFDYIRFPSDGDLKSMKFPIWDGKTQRREVIKEFFKYLRESMPSAKLSVDLFGLTAVNYDDLGVGQNIDDAFEYFDYICPMVYPSHYANGFLGHENPADYPYEVVKYSMEKAKKRLASYKELNETEDKKINAVLRPWLQDFDYKAVYDTSMVKSEIQAVQDALGEDYKGYMMWSPSNFYTTEAIKP